MKVANTATSRVNPNRNKVHYDFDQVFTYRHARIRLSDVDHRRIKLLLLIVCISDHQACQCKTDDRYS